MRWTLYPKPDPKKTTDLVNSLGVDPLIATLLLQRGIETFEHVRLF